MLRYYSYYTYIIYVIFIKRVCYYPILHALIINLIFFFQNQKKFFNYLKLIINIWFMNILKLVNCMFINTMEIF